MASQRRKSKKAVEFSWTDDALQLLLQVAPDHKAKCEFKAENWEKKRQNHEDIFDILMKEYPDEKEKYPNKEKISKKRATAKLKSIRSGFEKAIDCGKKSGWGRVVFTFFDFCNDLCVGCPALTSIQNSINTSKQLSNDNSDSFSPVGFSSILDIADVKDLWNEKEIKELSNEQEISKCQGENVVDADNSECDPTQPNARWTKVEEMLNERKDKKWTTKFSQEAQALHLSKEDLQLKKQLLQKF